MLMVSDAEKSRMLDRQIHFADKYKNEHPGVEMMVVWDGGGYHGDVLRENTKYEIVYRTDRQDDCILSDEGKGTAVDTVGCVVRRMVDNLRRGTVSDMAAASFEGGY